ncbi:MAG: hypothetical protein COU64_00845 [Candidatus Pacebacteria bacterium CG10_big_fil_rev_8_21_14_0_10_40_26]|nr:MAG: hypothetical protein COU64_00845 [Candidatus Pacebacteria bacterium CG10_big_fil_rev_8_21_14_0_10_40_26]
MLIQGEQRLTGVIIGDYWGVPWNERHCHNGGTVQGIQESAPVYNSPTNTPIPWPTWTPVPTKTPIPTITPLPTITITPKPTKIVTRTNKVQKQTVKKRTFWQWLFGK